MEDNDEMEEMEPKKKAQTKPIKWCYSWELNIFP
jgi:hypothetical protein